ncbi:hypothetical protein MSAS_18180 [Mycobacterium saskatchewanense]|nr:hypothetical protein MSAS_18180 [Mycobacterium saskatchewanense]
MNQPVGKRYDDSAMPACPNSRSDGSPAGSGAESEIICVTSTPYLRAGWTRLGRPSLTAVRRLLYFYYFKH